MTAWLLSFSCAYFRLYSVVFFQLLPWSQRFFLVFIVLVGAAREPRLSHAVKYQEKPLGPGYSTVGFSNEDNCCQLQGIGKMITEKLSKGIFKVV